jgi:uncharacterized membrane protein YfcA
MMCADQQKPASKAIPRLSPFLSVGLGSAIGVFASTTGLAGALISIPALTNFSALSASAVTGTTVAATSLSSFGATLAFATQDAVNFPLAALIGFSGVLSARLGAKANSVTNPVYMRRLSGLCILGMVPVVALSSRDENDVMEADAQGAVVETCLPEQDVGESQDKFSSRAVEFVLGNAKYMMLGVGAGFVQGLLGMGGGIMQCTFLTALGTMPQSEVIATTLCGTMILNTSAAWQFYKLGHVNIRASMLIAVTGAIMAAATTIATVKTDEGKLRKWLAAMMVLSSIGFFK